MKKLTPKERIERFITKHDNIVQKNFPKVLLRWRTTRGGEIVNHFFSACEGKLDGQIPEKIKAIAKIDGVNGYVDTNNFLSYKSGAKIRCASMVHDKKLGVLEVSVVTIDSRRYHPNETKRKWVRDENYSRLFFIKGMGKIPFNEKGESSFLPYIPTRRYYREEGGWWTSRLERTPVDIGQYARTFTKMWIFPSAGDALGEFAKDSLIRENGLIINPYTSYGFYYWIKYQIPAYKPAKSKRGKEIEKINQNLPPLSPTDTLKSNRFAIDVYVEKEKGNLILRYLSVGRKIFLETYRELISPNGRIKAYRLVNNNQWSSCPIRNKNNKPWCYDYQVRNIKGKELFASFPLTKYVFDIASEQYQNKDFIFQLLKLTAAPFIEKMFKAGFTAIAKELNEEPLMEEKALLSKFFGDTTKNKKLYSFLGMSKKQLVYLNQRLEEIQDEDSSCNAYGINYRERKAAISSIKTMKFLYGKNNISNMEFSIFKKLLEDIIIANSNYYGNKIYNILQSYVGVSLCKKLVKLGESSPIYIQEPRYSYEYPREAGGFHETWELLRDICQMLVDIPEENRPIIDFQRIKTNVDLQFQHDTIVAFYNAQQVEIARLKNEQQAKMLEKIDEERRYLEYEDDEFQIRLPKSAIELVEEGRFLSHCVGGYTDAHSKGRTTILFLRKKELPNTPFYTIEVLRYKKDPAVSQIHGKFNKWLGNNPEAIRFVLRWLKAKNIRCNDTIVLSTATGYSNNGAPLLEKPEI